MIIYPNEYSKDLLFNELSKYKNHVFGFLYIGSEYRCCCRCSDYQIRIFESWNKDMIRNYWYNEKIKSENSEIDYIEIYGNVTDLVNRVFDDKDENCLYWAKLDYKIKDYNYSKWYSLDFEYIYDNLKLIEENYVNK